MKSSRIGIFACAIATIALAACARTGTPMSRAEYVLGTRCSITVADHAAKETLDACFSRLREIDLRMSADATGSELDDINAAAGVAAIHVTEDVFTVMKRALKLARISGGLFDPTVGPLVKLWAINTDHARVPAPAEIARARRLINWRDVALDEAARTVFLGRPGMSLDLGGIAKGFAADEMARILRARGVRAAVIDLGGNILAMGEKPGGSPWRIGVQNPDAPRGSYFGIATVVNRALVTSGVYERFFWKDGKRYHHIMDTRTGSPIDNGIASVTVITDTSFDADGVTLTIFSLGPEKGLRLGKSLGAEVIIVTADHRVYASEGAKKNFAITDSSFAYAN